MHKCIMSYIRRIVDLCDIIVGIYWEGCSHIIAISAVCLLWVFGVWRWDTTLASARMKVVPVNHWIDWPMFLSWHVFLLKLTYIWRVYIRSKIYYKKERLFRYIIIFGIEYGFFPQNILHAGVNFGQIVHGCQHMQ